MKHFNRFLILSLSVLGLLTVVILGLTGESYYRLSDADRAFHELHSKLKPEGTIGHAYGFAGVLLIGINLLYLARRHLSVLRGVGTLKSWMEVHIFAGLIGPALILFHSAFLYVNPIAVTAMISLAILVITGIIGRYIYAQVPHSLNGTEEDMRDVRRHVEEAVSELVSQAGEDYTTLLEQLDHIMPETRQRNINHLHALLILPALGWRNWRLQRQIRQIYREFLTETKLSHTTAKPVLHALRRIARFRIRMRFLHAFRGLLTWWRGLHRYFALVMLLTALIHIAISVYMGARWLF